MHFSTCCPFADSNLYPPALETDFLLSPAVDLFAPFFFNNSSCFSWASFGSFVSFFSICLSLNI
jgi:hypothetical protein